MREERFYLSTIDPKAGQLAREYGLGVEIAEFCTAWNMDRKLSETDARVRQQLEGNRRRILHGPFNELFPCAIDPEARDLAARRYRQAIALARDYGADKVVIHAGFNPWLYYPVWFREQSAVFWREFLAEDPGVEIVLENVLEREPEWMLDILRTVDSAAVSGCGPCERLLPGGRGGVAAPVRSLDFPFPSAQQQRHPGCPRPPVPGQHPYGGAADSG